MITVVAGLPRSGTSLMMQMLHRGGMDILTDGTRAADRSNPNGYFEYEKVKRLAKDNSWMAEAEGKAVKVITHLLPHLLPRHGYRVVYMVRPIEEVICSQTVMLEKLGQTGAGLSAEVLTKTYAGQVERVRRWLERHPNILVHYVFYQEVLSDPQGQAAAVREFLGTDLDAAAMAGAVDAGLWRQRGR